MGLGTFQGSDKFPQNVILAEVVLFAMPSENLVFLKL
jgi:hypothetical protein